MNLGLRNRISLGPIIANALTTGTPPESDEKVRAHMAVRRERAIDVINVAKNMAGTMGMSPAVQAKFAWSPIEMHTIRDWIFWALGSGLEDPLRTRSVVSGRLETTWPSLFKANVVHDGSYHVLISWSSDVGL